MTSRMRRRRLALLSFALVLPLALASRSAAVPFSLALSLDGTDDYADIADNASLDLGTAATADFTTEAFLFVPNQTNDSKGVVFFKNLAYGLLVNFNPSSDDVLIFDFWSCPSSFCE